MGGQTNLRTSQFTRKFYHYAFAVAADLVALVVSLLFRLVEINFVFFFFFPAVILSAWVGGLGPGLLATALAILGVGFLTPPVGELTFNATNLLQLALFASITVFMSILRERNRRIEDEIAYQREAYRVTLASIGDGVIATDPAGKVTFMNDEAARLTGWTFAEAEGASIQTVFKIVNETTRQPTAIPIIEALQHGRVIGLANHTILIARNGREYAISDSGAPIRAEDGSIIGAVLVFRDVTSERHAERRLELLQELTAALAVAVTPTDVANAVVEKGAFVLGAHQGFVASATANRKFVELINTMGVIEGAKSQLARVPLNADFPYTDAIQRAAPVWMETYDAYAARYPKAAEISRTITGTRAVAALPIMSKGKATGSISLTFKEDHTFDEGERDFIIAFADLCGQALERARLFEQASELATLQERQRLARELHDAVSQSLFAANVLAESLPRLWERQPARVMEQLQQLHILTRGAWAEMRTLLLELRPENIVNTPLPGLLAQLSQSIHGRRHIPVDLQVAEEEGVRLPPNVHFALYRIAQEGLNNVVKHANTQQIRVRMRLRQTPQGAEITIVDNGVGFKLDDTNTGFGIVNMRERAEQIGATLTIRSKPGWGTRVHVEWRQPEA